MSSLSDAPAMTVPVAVLEPAAPRVIACPLCHTPEPTIDRATLDAGGRWKCRRCGQAWDAARLDAVAAYATWAAEHDRP